MHTLVVNVYHHVSTAQQMLLLAQVVFLIGFYKDLLVYATHHVKIVQKALILAQVVFPLTIW